MINLRDEPAPDDFDPTKYANGERKKRTPPGQTLAKKFPHLEYASIPKVENPEKWEIELFGEVEVPVKFQLGQLIKDLADRTTTLQHDFHCITGWSLFDTEWEGVLGSVLTDLVGPHDDVTTVLVHGNDLFSTCIWLEDFIKGILAWGYKGRPLAPHHGFPLRYVAPPHLYMFKSCKWVTGLEFLTEHKLGFWEIRAYSDSALVWGVNGEQDRYANPVAAQGKTAGQIRREFEQK